MNTKNQSVIVMVNVSKFEAAKGIESANGSGGRQTVDLVVSGQPQFEQQQTVRSRPTVLITTPKLMEKVVIAEIESDCGSKMDSVSILNPEQCLDDGFGETISVILSRCGAAKNGPKLMLCSNSTSSAMEQFVESLMSNQDSFRLIMAPSDGPEDEAADKVAESDLFANSNDDELDDRVLLNTLQLQDRMRKKEQLLSSLRALLMKWEYSESAATATALTDGSYHQRFNESASSNLTAKLDRMDSTKRFMAPQSAGTLAESVDAKQLKLQNERLREELEASRAATALLEDDRLNLTKALKAKMARIRQIEEERGIVVEDLRASVRARVYFLHSQTPSKSATFIGTNWHSPGHYKECKEHGNVHTESCCCGVDRHRFLVYGC